MGKHDGESRADQEKLQTAKENAVVEKRLEEALQPYQDEPGDPAE